MANKTQTRRAQKQTKSMQAYNKERKRILGQIRRAEARGYRFPSELKQIPTAKQLFEQTGSRNLSAQTRKLKAIRGEAIYKEASAISEQTGKVVKGTERRTEERRERSTKGAETRRKRERKRKDDDFKDYYTEYPSDKVNIGQQRLDGLWDLIDRFSSTHPHETGLLRNALSMRLAEEDIDDFRDELSNMPQDLIESANKSFEKYGTGSSQNTTIVNEILSFIWGRTPTGREMRMIQEYSDMDDYEEY